MTNDELRALADALQRMADDDSGIPQWERDTTSRAADYLRAQADAQPVATLTLLDDMGAQIDFRQSFTLLPGQTFSLYAHPAPQAEPKREPLSDERITKGEYVLATKWGDGDPGDHWGVGFYDRFENGRHYVVDRAGKQIRGNGFRRVGRITVDVGRWLLSAAKSLEASPPGTVNLWTMLTERAHEIGGSDAE